MGLKQVRVLTLRFPEAVARPSTCLLCGADIYHADGLFSYLGDYLEDGAFRVIDEVCLDCLRAQPGGASERASLTAERLRDRAEMLQDISDVLMKGRPDGWPAVEV